MDTQVRKAPTVQDIKTEMESNYSAIFPKVFKVLNFLLIMQIGNVSVERLFSK